MLAKWEVQYHFLLFLHSEAHWFHGLYSNLSNQCGFEIQLKPGLNGRDAPGMASCVKCAKSKGAAKSDMLSISAVV